ncbi:uncharacterized protein [Asterias amurensis]|uniref:uncharacterized protein n=1 Tax=Asterias amurensis TaxID=7602 RepID=UPI003AB65FB9
MSLSYAIGSRTHAQPQRKGKTSASKTNQSTTTGGTKTKSTTTTTKVNTPPKPRVVTLANLKQTSADRGKKTTKIHSRTPKKTAAQPAVRINKMWDERESQSLSATGRNSMSVRGDRNAIANGGYSNRASSSTNGPAARGRLPGGDESLSHGQPTPGEERRDTYQPNGGYTLHTPNPKKREQLQNGANNELERLAAYKEKKRVGHVSITPGRVGGNKMSEEQVRRQQVREQEKKKFDNIRKRQQWAEEKKAREDKEINEMKARAREQTERNKRKEEQRQRNMTSDRQRWMECGGLEKLEGEEAKRSGSSVVFGSNESSLQGLTDMFPFKSPEKLKEMLKAANGDVNKVIDWLSN